MNNVLSKYIEKAKVFFKGFFAKLFKINPSRDWHIILAVALLLVATAAVVGTNIFLKVANEVPVTNMRLESTDAIAKIVDDVFAVDEMFKQREQKYQNILESNSYNSKYIDPS